MRRVALQRVAGRLLDVQPHTKIDRGVYWNVCADFLWGWRGVRGYAVADECNGRNWTTGDCAGPRTGDWILGDQEAFDDGHVVLLAGTTGGCGGGGVFAALGDTGGSVAKRSTGYAGIDAGFSELGGIGAGGDDYVLPGVCGVRDGGG